VVKAQLEGLSFSVSYVSLQKFVTYVLLLITLIEILFSRPIICHKYLYYFPWAYLLCMLMDYASLYANILYNFHMIVYLGLLRTSCRYKALGHVLNRGLLRIQMR
jgi:hypothetical protein